MLIFTPQCWQIRLLRWLSIPTAVFNNFLFRKASWANAIVVVIMFKAFVQIANSLLMFSFTWTINFDIGLLYLSFRGFFFWKTVLCKILKTSRFAGCSWLMFFRLVVVLHMDSRAWMIYGRLAIHKMFRTNPVVFPVSYWARYLPGLSKNRPQHMYSLDLYDGNYAKCKTPSSISAADMYCYCSQRLHKSSFPYIKILLPVFSFSKHDDRRKT